METKLDKDIREAQARLAGLEKEKVEREAKEAPLTDAQRLAVHLHETFCHHNHTDMCGWYYDDVTNPRTWTNTYSAHKYYLEKADAALKVADAETIMNIAFALKGI